MKTIIYLDVDGVLNAVNYDAPEGTGWSDTGWHYLHYVNGYPFLYHEDVIARLNAIAARDDVEVRWLTTWLDQAGQILPEIIGINGRDWLPIGDQHYARHHHTRQALGWWKHDAIIEDLASLPKGERVRIVWIDDDIKVFPKTMVLDLIEESNPHVRMMNVSPRTETGLTSTHMEAIESFIDGLLDEEEECSAATGGGAGS